MSLSQTSGSQNAASDGSNDMLPQHPYMRLDIPIPESMTSSPMSNLSSIATPSVCTPGRPLFEPAMQHPTPMSNFDFSAFQEQIRTFDAPDMEHTPNGHASFGHMGQDVFDTALGLVSLTPYTNHPSQAYSKDVVQLQATEQPFYPVEAAPEHVRNVAQPYSEDSCLQGRSADVLTADLRSYKEGSHCYTQPQMALPQALDFNELIVEGY